MREKRSSGKRKSENNDKHKVDNRQKLDPQRRPTEYSKRRDTRNDPSNVETRQKPHRKFDNYATLTHSSSDMWKKFAAKGYFENPLAIKSSVDKRKEIGKYCDCHKDWGHNTDDCYYL